MLTNGTSLVCKVTPVPFCATEISYNYNYMMKHPVPSTHKGYHFSCGCFVSNADITTCYTTHQVTMKLSGCHKSEIWRRHQTSSSSVSVVYPQCTRAVTAASPLVQGVSRVSQSNLSCWMPCDSLVCETLPLCLFHLSSGLPADSGPIVKVESHALFYRRLVGATV